MNKLIHSWDDNKDFVWAKEDLNSIYYNLKKFGYLLPPQKPSDLVVKIINKIVVKLLNDEWLILLSNNYNLLAQLSNLIPITYSLNSMYSCMNVTTNEVYKALYESSFDDSVLNTMKLSTLLYWSNVAQSGPNVSKYSGVFFDLISTRAKRKCTTVFTHLYNGERAPSTLMRTLGISISTLFGEGTTAIIKEKITPIDIPIEVNNSWDKIGEI